MQSPVINPVKDKRHYDKPWQKNANSVDKAASVEQLKKEDKEKNAYLYNMYPDGNGPDAELINGLQRDILESDLKISFDDIADLGDAKNIIKEAALMPILKP